MEVKKVHKLFNDTYLVEMESCLLIVKVNNKGDIVKMTSFGGDILNK